MNRHSHCRHYSALQHTIIDFIVSCGIDTCRLQMNLHHLPLIYISVRGSSWPAQANKIQRVYKSHTQHSDQVDRQPTGLVTFRGFLPISPFSSACHLSTSNAETGRAPHAEQLFCAQPATQAAPPTSKAELLAKANTRRDFKLMYLPRLASPKLATLSTLLFDFCLDEYGEAHSHFHRLD